MQRTGKVGVWLTLLCFVFLLGCSKYVNDDGTRYNKEKTYKVKVLYFSNEQFMREYGTAFMVKYPNIELEVISPPKLEPNKDMREELEAFIIKEQIDVIYYSAYYEEWSKQGFLYPLDSLIKKDKFDIEHIFSGVTRHLRQKENGALYGLSPTFADAVLYYNKDLFDQNMIPYPQDGMSWEEILLLAQRFSTEGAEEERNYGLYVAAASPFSLADQIAETNDIPLISADGKELNLLHDDWKSILHHVMEAYRTGAVYSPESSSNSSYETYMKANKFIAGKAAMAIDQFYLTNNIEQGKRLEMGSFQWDMVSGPVDPGNSGASTSFRTYDVFSIYAKSANLIAAWELVKFINGDEMAKIASKTSTTRLLSRQKYITGKDTNHNYNAFYFAKMGSRETDEQNPAVGSLRSLLGQLLVNQMNELKNGKKSAEQIIQELYEAGQAEWLRINDEKNP